MIWQYLIDRPGIIAGLVFLTTLLVVLVKYRREEVAPVMTTGGVKPTPPLLQNRDALIKALWEVRQAAVNVVALQDRSRNTAKSDRSKINWGAVKEFGEVDKNCQLRLADLDKELLVAGPEFRECASALTTFVYTQLQFRKKGIAPCLVLSAVQFTARILELVDETVQKIDSVKALGD